MSKSVGWYALWTKSRCEQLVCDQLAGKGLHPFLPKLGKSSLFPGYLFLHDVLDRGCYGSKTGWDAVTQIPEAQIGAVVRLVDSRGPLLAHPYLQVGRRVRVVRGPLEGVEGILHDVVGSKGRLVVSIQLLQRSVSTEMSCADVAAA